jgi:hypothetical protein
MFFFHFGAIWAPPNEPKKILKNLQVGKTYGPMSELENKPLTKLIGPFFQEKLSETTSKKGFYAVFSHVGAIWALPNGPKKVPEGLQVGRTYGLMSGLKKNPLTKLFVGRMRRYGGEHCQKICFSTFFGYFWAQMSLWDTYMGS